MANVYDTFRRIADVTYPLTNTVKTLVEHAKKDPKADPKKVEQTESTLQGLENFHKTSTQILQAAAANANVHTATKGFGFGSGSDLSSNNGGSSRS